MVCQEIQNITKNSQNNINNHDSADVVSQTQSLEQTLVLSIPISPSNTVNQMAADATVETTEITKGPESIGDSSVDVTQTQSLNDEAEKDSQGPLLEQTTVALADVIVDIGMVYEQKPEQKPGVLRKNFQTGRIKIKNDTKTIHYPIKVDFNRTLWEPIKNENGKEIRVSYSALCLQKICRKQLH